jgi:hypothetical protein
VGESGVGNYHGEFSLHAFSYKRGIMRRDDHTLLDAPIRYPPYSQFAVDAFLLLGKLPNIPAGWRLPSYTTTLAVVSLLVAGAAAYSGLQ